MCSDFCFVWTDVIPLLEIICHKYIYIECFFEALFVICDVWNN